MKRMLLNFIYVFVESHKFSNFFAVYVVGSKSFRRDIQKPRQMENAVRDI